MTHSSIETGFTRHIRIASVSLLLACAFAHLSIVLSYEPPETLGASVITCCDFSASGQTIVTTDGKRVACWNLVTGRQIQEFSGHSETIHAVRISANGRNISSAAGATGDAPAADAKLRVWSIGDSEPRAVLKHASAVLLSQFQPNGDLVVSFESRLIAHVWNLNNHTPVFQKDIRVSRLTRDFSIDDLMPVCFSPDGRRVMGIIRDTSGFRVAIWESGSGAVMTNTQPLAADIRTTTFDRSGRLIVTACGDGVARTWNATTGDLLAELRGHTGRLCSAVFAPDSSSIVTSSTDATARKWSASDGGENAVMRHRGPLAYALVSEDGTRILTRWETKQDQLATKYHATLWDAGNGTEIKTFALRDDSAIAMFVPGGKQVFLTLERTSLVNAQTGTIDREFE